MKYWNFNFAVIFRFGEIQINRKIAQIFKSIKAYKKHGIKIFESPNLNIKARLKLYPNKIHIPELGQVVSSFGVLSKTWRSKNMPWAVDTGFLSEP